MFLPMMLIHIFLLVEWLLTNYTVVCIGKLFLRLELDASNFHVRHQLYLHGLINDG